MIDYYTCRELKFEILMIFIWPRNRQNSLTPSFDEIFSLGITAPYWESFNVDQVKKAIGGLMIAWCLRRVASSNSSCTVYHALVLNCMGSHKFKIKFCILINSTELRSTRSSIRTIIALYPWYHVSNYDINWHRLVDTCTCIWM